jgi:integrase
MSNHIYWINIGQNTIRRHKAAITFTTLAWPANLKWANQMGRTVRDTKLETRGARARLPASTKPYYRSIDPGLQLGYRRGKSAGRWLVRRYAGNGKYVLDTIATADDNADADGINVLDYRQAQAKARVRAAELSGAAAGVAAPKGRPYSVADALADYLEWMQQHRKSATDARCRAEAHILPALGKIELSKLTTDQLRKWFHALADSPARLRTRKGEAQKFRAAEATGDAIRSRRASANRTLNILKAALNQAWNEGKTPSDLAWRRLKRYRNVDTARARYLNIDEAVRLINAAEGDFRSLVQGALMTGARYGELCAMNVADFNADSGTVAIRQSKGGAARHVVLTEEGSVLFSRLIAGRKSGEPLFQRADGSRWDKSQQARLIKEACKRASLESAISFHGLRHTYASLAVMKGTPLLVVAKNLGHADTRMVEKHYGHLAPSYITDAIRAGAPRFEIAHQGNVIPLKR